MSIVMYDSVTLSEVPASPPAVACYRDGRFANESEARHRFPHAQILAIAVRSGTDADCLDIETGDATPSEGPAWVKRQLARGVQRPVLYANLSTMPAVVQALANAGINRSQVRLWVAHYTHVEHLEPGFDACQWTDRALGRNLDQSLCAADFFVTPKPPVPQARAKGVFNATVSYDHDARTVTVRGTAGQVESWGDVSEVIRLELDLPVGKANAKRGQWSGRVLGVK